MELQIKILFEMIQCVDENGREQNNLSDRKLLHNIRPEFQYFCVFIRFLCLSYGYIWDYQGGVVH